MLLSILAHHSEAADPALVAWIKHQLDSMLGLGPLAMVIALGAVILLIPSVIMFVYLVQRLRRDRS